MDVRSYDAAVCAGGLVESLLGCLHELPIEACEPPIGMLSRLVLSSQVHATSFVGAHGISHPILAVALRVDEVFLDITR